MNGPPDNAKVCIIFGHLDENELPESIFLGLDVLITEHPKNLFTVVCNVEPLDRFKCKGEKDVALDLLQVFNQLRDSNGSRLCSYVKFDEYEPWWFHQEAMYNYWLVPFARYKPLLEYLSRCEKIILINCPVDLRGLLRLCFPKKYSSIQFCNTSTSPCSKASSIGAFKLLSLASRYLFEFVFSFLSLMWALIRRPKVLFYVIDIVSPGKRWDARLDGVYSHLANSNIKFLEILWTSQDRPVMKNARRRLRSGVYLEVIWALAKVLYKIGWLHQVTPQRPQPQGGLRDIFLSQLAYNQLLPACVQSSFVAGSVKRLVSLISPAWFLAIDDHRHMYETVVACKQQGITTMAVQHGQFNRYSVGLRACGSDTLLRHSVDEYYLWSNFFRSLLLRISNLYTSQQLDIGGFPRLPDISSLSALQSVLTRFDSNQLKVLIISELYDPAVLVEEVEPYMAALISDPRLEIFLKLKPGQIEIPYKSLERAGEIRVLTGTIWNALSCADVVVGSYSSALFDAILLEKPVVLFTTSIYHDPHGLAETGVAFKATDSDLLVSQVYDAAALSASDLTERKALVWGRVLQNAGLTIAERIASEKTRQVM